MEARHERRTIPREAQAERRPSAPSVGALASLSTKVQTALVPDWGPESLKRQYVAAVLARYLWLPETPTRTSRHDHRLARRLYEGGVPLIAVEAALLLGAARRSLRGMSAPPLVPVRALHYFNPVITEVMNEGDLDVTYMTYLLQKLRPLAELKLARLGHRARYGGTPDKRSPST